MKRALITGITGQDGSYLAELLLRKGYEVFGIIRRASSFNTGRIEQIYEDPHTPNTCLHLIFGDLNDASSLIKFFEQFVRTRSITSVPRAMSGLVSTFPNIRPR